MTSGKKEKLRLLFVVQRYGSMIDGGAELYCRWLTQHLRSEAEITVLTTCAKSYITWANELPDGKCIEEGMEIIRYPVDRQRDMERFNRMTDHLLSNPHTMEDETNWLIEQGPYSTGLINYINVNHQNYDYLLFITYLYYPTVAGSKIAPEKSILIPTAHDEPVAQFAIFKDLFSRVAGHLFLTRPEMEFATTHFAIQERPRLLLGTGVAIPDSTVSSKDWLSIYKINTPVVLYIGRIEAGKGCLEVIDYFKKFKAATHFQGTLVLAGRNHISFTPDESIRLLGFIPDEHIKPALQSADLVIVPSAYESLSILLLQGFMSGKPALVNARSDVLKDHCLTSNAGLFYQDYAEFEMALNLLMSNEELRKTFGVNGRKYVQSHFDWNVVRDNFFSFITELSK